MDISGGGNSDARRHEWYQRGGERAQTLVIQTGILIRIPQKSHESPSGQQITGGWLYGLNSTDISYIEPKSGLRKEKWSDVC